MIYGNISHEYDDDPASIPLYNYDDDERTDDDDDDDVPCAMTVCLIYPSYLYIAV